MNRLVRVRKSWIIVIGVLITPALYAWFNINAFWDPYSNTENIKIAVANLDSGADSDLTGEVNIGDQVVTQLKGNDQLGWQFMDDTEAQTAVKRGDVYAAIIIPEAFSSDLLSMTTGEFTQPALQYYVNEKASAIAPKITDVGASQLDKQITSAFKEEVAHAVTEAVTDAGDSVELQLLNARGDTLNAFGDTLKTLDNAAKNIDRVRDGIDSSRASLAGTRGTLAGVGRTLTDVQAAVGQAQSIIAETQRQVVAFSDAATGAYLKGSALLSDAAADAHVSVTELTQQLKQANVRIDASITEITGAVAANGQAIDQLQALIDSSEAGAAELPQLTSALEALQAQNAAHQEVLATLGALNGDTAGAIDAVAGASAALNQAMLETRSATAGMRDVIGQTMPTASAAMNQLSASAGAFASAIGAQQAVLQQADTLLAGIDTQLTSTATALDSFDQDLAGIRGSVTTARADVLALGAASEWGNLATLTGLDAGQIAEFVSSPVTVDEQVVFPINAYGSAMAALFTNLSLWIGAFVLMVIFKIEVDTEGLEDVTVRQAYFGRFFLLGTLAMLQALIVCVGNLIIGVQTASAIAFVATGIFTALVYVSIIYALSVAFGHVGRGLCVLLVIMQIPGASGLYPIELMPGFFRAIYPLLPFSYGIDAMRETIAGFYGGHYWRFVGVLTLMMLLAVVLGLVLRRRLANFNLLFNRQIASTDLLIGEKVQVVGSGYRLGDVIHALQNKGEFRADLDRRARPFTQHYPALVRGTLVFGAVGMAVIGVVAWLLPGGKAPLLGIWVAWCLLVMGALVVIEYIKQSFVHAEEVASLGDDELRDAVLGDRTSLHDDDGGERVPATVPLPVARAGAANPAGSHAAEAAPGGHAGDDIDEVIADWFGDDEGGSRA